MEREEFLKRIQELKKTKSWEPLRFTFKSSVTIPLSGSRWKVTEKDENGNWKNKTHVQNQKTGIVIDLFVAEALQGALIYTNRRNGRRGIYIGYMPYKDCISIEKLEKTTNKMSLEQLAHKVKSALHPNAWLQFQQMTDERLAEDFQSSHRKFVNIKSLLKKKCPWDYQGIMKRIENAFNNKTALHERFDGNKRDYTIEVKPESNGVRAWFSSEFSGCGNGSYYLLLNPTTAVHYEDD